MLRRWKYGPLSCAIMEKCYRYISTKIALLLRILTFKQYLAPSILGEHYSSRLENLSRSVCDLDIHRRVEADDELSRRGRVKIEIVIPRSFPELETFSRGGHGDINNINRETTKQSRTEPNCVAISSFSIS